MINVARDPWRNGLLLFEKDVCKWLFFKVDIFPPDLSFRALYFLLYIFRNSGFKNNEPKVQEHVVKNCLLLYLWYLYFTWVHYVIIYVLLFCVVLSYVYKGNLTKKNPIQKNKRPFLINYGKTSCFSALVTKHKYISLPGPLFNIAQGSQP